MRNLLFLTLPVAALATLAAPAAGQDSPGDKVNMVDVYGDEACPQSTPEVITICRKLDEADRFRIPEALRDDPNSPRHEAWSNRVQAYETVGAQGIASCSPVGPGGASGCMTQLIDAAYKARREAATVRYGALIAAEREKRLAEIDQEAAETQARVEQLEKEYDAKVARERAAEDAAADAAPLPKPPGK